MPFDPMLEPPIPPNASLLENEDRRTVTEPVWTWIAPPLPSAPGPAPRNWLENPVLPAALLPENPQLSTSNEPPAQ
jgi:hypothetical protein